jgi:hypothetical protein
MILTLKETMNRYLGWCPDAHMVKTKSGSNAGPDYRGGNLSIRSPVPSGADQGGKPWDWWYEHTQRGSLIIWSVTAVAIVLLASMYLFGVIWVTALVLGVMIFMLAICSTLTVSVCDDTLRIRFGPVGLIRKSWPITDIASVTTVTNPWYYGWGIRITPHGLLYNVSGFGAVEVRLLNGKSFRIGTDEPRALGKAIEDAVARTGTMVNARG